MILTVTNIEDFKCKSSSPDPSPEFQNVRLYNHLLPVCSIMIDHRHLKFNIPKLNSVSSLKLTLPFILVILARGITHLCNYSTNIGPTLHV